MKLIIGLGNPTEQYIKNRHNLGSMMIDQLAKTWGVHFQSHQKLKSELLVTMRDKQTVVLAKPQTYMNDSGKAVQKIKSFYKLENDDIWVVSDDLDLDFGIIRTRVGGSSGGHNGLKDIIENIGEDFVRIRCGIKNPELQKIPADKFVLQNFSKSEQDKLNDIISHTIATIENALQDGMIADSKALL